MKRLTLPQMLRQRFTLSACLAVCLLAAPIQVKANDLSQLVGTLLRRHPYVLDEEQKVRLEKLYREFRESLAKEQGEVPSVVRPKGSLRGPESTIRPSWPAGFGLVSVLDESPQVIRIDLTSPEAPLPKLEPVHFPGYGGALLFRIVTGGSETRYFVNERTLAGESEVQPIVVQGTPDGITWALTSLADIPFHQTSLLVEFRADEREPIRFPVDVRTPSPGRLKLTVLSADSGQPVPAMLRMVWKPDGLDYRPSNVVEFVDQFDGYSTSQRPVFLPGRLRGEYWCVAGPIDMALAPGEWQISIRRGLEHVPLFETIHVHPDQTVEKLYQPPRWVDMPGLGWFSGDDHVHFRILDDDDAERLMTWIRAEDLHVANVVKMGDASRTYFEQRGFGPAYRVVSGNYALVPGQECPRTGGPERLGHVLALNTRSMVRDTAKYFLYDWVFDKVHAQGGLVGYAHVNRSYARVHRDMSLNVPKAKIDFVEILQAGVLGTNLFYDFLNLGFKLTASAGSDVPFAGTVGEVRVYAYTGQDFRLDAWFAALEQGKTFVTNGPMIEFTVDGNLPGEELTLETDQIVTVSARTWGHPQRSLPKNLEIVRHGEIIRSVVSDDLTEDELSVSFDLAVEDGFWIAARSEARDGSRAHTTPVYVVRPSLRFWKYEEAGKLISSRLRSLDEVEANVARAQRFARSKDAPRPATDLPTGRWWHLFRLAEQGDALLERVAQARKIYQGLQKTLLRESPLRGATK